MGPDLGGRDVSLGDIGGGLNAADGDNPAGVHSQILALQVGGQDLVVGQAVGLQARHTGLSAHVFFPLGSF